MTRKTSTYARKRRLQGLPGDPSALWSNDYRTLQTALRRAAEAQDTFTTGNSYLGLLRQASHSHTDRARLAKALMRQGHAVNGDFSKIFRKAA